jgi:predicted XRE-type DNA-binding protein
MKKQTFSSVWDAIEDSKEQALNLKVRSRLMSALCEELKRRKLSQPKAAQILGVTQPRISDLQRGRVDLFSIDTLINMLGTLETPISIEITNGAVEVQTTSL